ncbi:MAG TPA: MauE/DoxX family redox-associated membrane protein [Puia sp.]|uniref:TlpA family protein disulfide reductase n=1 Tax=Puia sp. TaxID=2045100 RepID=UPI002BA10617|nr:MauE/DoxX family redox-associated membrane protein [Puia sp.]HVU95498.1 MauE/DoxX family redox-associated membrane protein [Puia sp.]
MNRSILADVIAFFFIFLFVYTGAIKLTEIQTFRQQLSSSPLMSSMAGVITWALPIGELLLAIALFLPRTRLKALYTTAALMTAFTVYVVIILLIDNELTCSCGGIIEELTPKQHVAFNSACVILAVIGILALRKQQPTRNFRRLTHSSALALFALVTWFLVSAFRQPSFEKTGLEGRLIPSIPLQLTDSTTWLKTENIPAGKPFIVLGFSPWCVHCQALTVDIKQHINNFKDIPIYYITPDRFKNMRTFYRFYKLSQYPNITMGRDSANSFFHFFKTNTTPLIAIYDAKKRLKRVIPGQPKAIDLLKSLQE